METDAEFDFIKAYFDEDWTALKKKFGEDILQYDWLIDKLVGLSVEAHGYGFKFPGNDILPVFRNRVNISFLGTNYCPIDHLWEKRFEGTAFYAPNHALRKEIESEARKIPKTLKPFKPKITNFFDLLWLQGRKAEKYESRKFHIQTEKELKYVILLLGGNVLNKRFDKNLGLCCAHTNEIGKIIEKRKENSDFSRIKKGLKTLFQLEKEGKQKKKITEVYESNLKRN